MFRSFSSHARKFRAVPPVGFEPTNGESIPVTVRVQWTDGTEGEVSAWTSQWTRTHVRAYRETAPPYHTFWVRAGDVRRRETDA